MAVSSSLSDWLRVNGLEKFEKNFMDHGFDHLDFIGPDLIRAEELKAMGIKDQGDIMRIERAIQKNRLMEHSGKLQHKKTLDTLITAKAIFIVNRSSY